VIILHIYAFRYESRDFSEAVDKAYKKKAEPPPLANATAKQGQAVTVADLLLRVHIGMARSAVEALQAPRKLPEFFAKTDDIVLPYLDALHSAEMDFNNHKIYLELTQKFGYCIDVYYRTEEDILYNRY
jgi:cysteinyl-tRNA synthetase